MNINITEMVHSTEVEDRQVARDYNDKAKQRIQDRTDRTADDLKLL